jgi:hypothetical protein
MASWRKNRDPGAKYLELVELKVEIEPVDRPRRRAVTRHYGRLWFKSPNTRRRWVPAGWVTRGDQVRTENIFGLIADLERSVAEQHGPLSERANAATAQLRASALERARAAAKEVLLADVHEA